MKAAPGNHCMPQTYIRVWKRNNVGPRRHVYVPWLQPNPTPWRAWEPQFKPWENMPKPNPSCTLMHRKTHQISFQESLQDHCPKQSADHMSDLETKPLSTECGMSNSILTDVISRAPAVTAWSFPFLQTTGKYVLICLGLQEGLTVSSLEGSSLLEVSQDVFLSPAFSTF